VVRSRDVRGAALLWAVVLVVAGCGGSRQDADEPEGDYTLQIVGASFPARQTPAQHATMRISVRNTDDRDLPNLALTVQTDASVKGNAPTAFGQVGADTRLADADRPVWIVDRGPEGAESAYTNTWALGRVFPGETKEAEWRLTAVRPGRYTIRYAAYPGLNGKAKVANGQKNTGSFDVTISDEPVPARVNAEGAIVRGER
jgi:hypothetical protein